VIDNAERGRTARKGGAPPAALYRATPWWDYLRSHHPELVQRVVTGVLSTGGGHWLSPISRSVLGWVGGSARCGQPSSSLVLSTKIAPHGQRQRDGNVILSPVERSIDETKVGSGSEPEVDSSLLLM
jgi:hypothetical protein